MIKFENTVTPSAEQWKAIIMGCRNPLNSWHLMDSFLCTEGTMTNEEIEATCGKCTKKDCCDIYDEEPHFIIGPNDYDLMKRLRNAGTDHRKFMRMITVYVDITAPLYWWKEFDTYKVATVANSCSTMHKIHAKEFTLEDFSCEHLFGPDDMLDYDERVDPAKDNALAAVNVDGEWCYFTPQGYIQMTSNILNHYRELYLNCEAKLKRTDLTDAERKHVSAQKKKYWWQMIQLLPSSYNQKRTVLLNYEVLANMYKSRRLHKLNEWRELCAWIETLPYHELITGEFKED